MIHYTQCPSCGSTDIAEKYTTTDYSISGEQFKINNCNYCGLLFTQDVPAQEEIGRYYHAEQYISHSDTSKGLVNKLYHIVRKQTLKGKYKLVKTTTGLPKGNILDIGSGTGAFLNTMHSAGWTITGIEPDETARNNANQLYGIQAIEPGLSVSLHAESFDAITMWHVLEHVHQLDGQMKELNRLLKPGGRILIAVPNHTSYDARHYGKYWAAWDVPRHLYHFSPSSMKVLCNHSGLEIMDIKPMWFDSFYVSMLSEKYKTGKTNLLNAVRIGILSNWKALLQKTKCSSVIYVIRRVGEG